VAIEHMDELYRLLTEERVGKTTELVVLRDLEKHALLITPADAEVRKAVRAD
jgi:S1-C subfamily serine protease